MAKTRRAPSRHRRDAGGYGHTTRAMHGIEYIPRIECTPPAVCKAHQPYRGFAHRYQQQPRYEERNRLMTVPVAVSATALGGGTGDGTGD